MAKCEKCFHNNVCEKKSCSECSGGFGCDECEIYHIYDEKPNIENCKDFTPTADVVEVVRCKDCRFKTLTEDGEYNPHDIVCEIHMSDGFNETDYCSYGERKCDNG